MLARAARNALCTANKLPFCFRGCLNAKQQTRTVLPARAATTSAIRPASVDDTNLIAFFDQPYALQKPTSPTGIFGHHMLTTPAALNALADSTIRRAELLTERILRARESRAELFKVVKNLDRLSDMLCGVIDLAELLRNAHPDPVWVRSADEVYERLCQFMNVLNTNVGLYEVLRAVLTDDVVVKSLGSEAYQTALIFRRDFEKSGIDLPPGHRERFVSLSTEILVLGRQFLNEAAAARPPARIHFSEMQGLKDLGMGARLRLQAQMTKRDLLVYPGSLQAQMIMRSAPAEEPRKKLYLTANTSTPEQIEILERLLRARGELARLVGKESFAHMTLGDKMAKCPDNVLQFLEASSNHTRPYARRALRALSLRKQMHLDTPPLPTIQAWDRDYYCPPEPPAPLVSLPPLTVGTVFMALSRLFQSLYGVSLRLHHGAPGEVWHTDVRKLEVVDEERGILGWIYADLYARVGKPGGAAHYTVRCSRRTDDDEQDDLKHADEHTRATVQLSQEFEAGRHYQLPGQTITFQLPVVVLLCEFMRPTIGRGPSMLEWHEVLTLFHEMGHAMHSMIGRTEYQNISGTRCATDFVELPSILMEHFLNSPTVLSLFDRDGTFEIRQLGNQREDPCRSIDTHTQILLAMLDQAYHSSAALKSNFNSTATLADLHNSRGLIPYVSGTSWQTQFGHLFGYGATYYSYLFDRAIASRVWQKLFSQDPLNRNTGEKYKREVLRFGGAKDAWEMVGSLLGSDVLMKGDGEAMAEIGRWKIEDEVASSGTSRH